MTSADPWKSVENFVTAQFPQEQGFEDDFTVPIRYNLPDSDQYLALLEAKLKKIKNDPDLLKQLREKREACMQNLLNNQNYTDFAAGDEDNLDEPAKSDKYRVSAPAKGEVVDLLQYEQLPDKEDDSE